MEKQVIVQKQGRERRGTSRTTAPDGNGRTTDCLRVSQAATGRNQGISAPKQSWLALLKKDDDLLHWQGCLRMAEDKETPPQLAGPFGPFTILCVFWSFSN